MNRIFGGLWLVGAACAVQLGACAPNSSEIGQTDPDAGAELDGGGGEDGGGAEACEPGATRTAPDGCNSCTCDDDGEGFLCTEIGCECKVGDTRTAEDGCSTCKCDGGLWQCDDAACAVCTPGETRKSDDMCSTCTCETDGTWDCPPTGTGCGTQCNEGAMRPAGDGCNTCSCFHGTWGCTMLYCQPPLMCAAGLADCDADPGNDCETNILDSVANCGTCGNYCAIVGAEAACVAGKCVIEHCSAPYADCNGDPSDGCEVPTGDAGCKTRCEAPAGSPAITPAAGDCECPKGATCVRNSAPGNVDLCYPNPEGCGSGLGTCGCLGSCVCPQTSDQVCTEQMAPGGVFILDCDSLN